MVPGRYTVKQCSSLNQKRLFAAYYRSSEKACKRRKILRGQKKSTMDKQEDDEGELYATGAF
jgi:hypothetical protein